MTYLKYNRASVTVAAVQHTYLQDWVLEIELVTFDGAVMRVWAVKTEQASLLRLLWVDSRDQLRPMVG